MLKLALNAQSTRRPTFILGRARQRSRRPPSSWSGRCRESQRPPPSWSGHGRSSRCRPQAVRTRQRIVTEYSSSKQSIFIFKYMAENLVHRPRSLWLCAVQILAWGIALQRSVLHFGKKGGIHVVPRFHRFRWYPLSDMGIYGIRDRYGYGQILWGSKLILIATPN